MTTSPIVYGIPDNLAVYSDSGASFSVSARSAAAAGAAAAAAAPGAARRRPGDGRPDAARPTIPTSVAGHAAAEARATWRRRRRRRRRAVAVRACRPTSSSRNAAQHHSARSRPRVALRFARSEQLLVSGLLDGGGDIAQRPVVVDVAGRQGTRRAVREQPDLARQHDRQLLHGVQHDPELRQPRRGAKLDLVEFAAMQIAKVPRCEGEDQPLAAAFP